MRIALIANCPVAHNSMGGGDRIMIEMAKFWQTQGAQTVLFGPPESISVAKLGDLETDHVVTSNYAVERLGIARAYLGRIWSAFRDKRRYGSFDLIYSASEALPDIILSLKIKRQNPKALWVVGFFLKAKNPFRGEAPLSGKFISLFLQQQLSLWLMRLFRVNGIIYMGKEEENLINSMGFKKIYRIWAAADTETIKKAGEPVKIYDACFVGRLSYQKGIDDLLEVWRQVVLELPQAVLAIVGWGYERGQEKFLAEIKRLGLEKNIIYHGFLEGEKKFEIIKKSKIAVLPSRYESFGIVFLEALCCGLPVVAYDLPVLKESFSRGVAYVQLGNTTAMSRRVVKLLGNDEERQRLSREGLEISQQFSWEKVGQKTWQFINNLLV